MWPTGPSGFTLCVAGKTLIRQAFSMISFASTFTARLSRRSMRKNAPKPAFRQTFTGRWRKRPANVRRQFPAKACH